MARYLLFVFILGALSVQPAARLGAQVLDPAYAGAYVISNLGGPPGVPTQLGGLTLKYDDPNILLIGGAANLATGGIYALPLIRSGGHIVGFGGPAVPYCAAAYNDGGVVFGPNNILFLAGWPVNTLGQVLPGSTVVNKLIDMTAFGVEASLAALNFVPPGFPGAGGFKLVTYSGGQWLTAGLAPDGSGTLDVVNVTDVPTSRLTCGPEGFVYVPAGLPLFPNQTMLVAEYGCGTIGAFDISANGDPIPASRRVFISFLQGAEGALIDPLTGDFLFSTFGGNNRVIVVRGFSNVCSTCRGDLNADNITNGGDVQQFVTCYLQSGSPQGLCRCGDMDNNDDVGDSDVPLFIDKIMGITDPDPACP